MTQPRRLTVGRFANSEVVGDQKLNVQRSVTAYVPQM